MEKLLPCCTVFLLLIQPCSAQVENKPTGQFAPTPLPRLAEVGRVEAQPKKGFIYPYYYYVPPELWAEKGKRVKQTLLVLPINTGKTEDDFAEHDNYARRNVEDLRRLASNLKVALLMPAFPRTSTDWRIYTHALDRDSLLTEKKEFRRFDRQLNRMIEDALKLYPKVGHSLSKQMWDDIKAFFSKHLRD
ncbi:MAG: hypothetical protein ACREBC_20670 [Pyrinomonadaceae bacterium]